MDGGIYGKVRVVAYGHSITPVGKEATTRGPYRNVFLEHHMEEWSSHFR